MQMDSLNSNYLDAFYTTCQAKSFTKAAQILNITQSALSQRVKNLEDQLETTLLIRDRSGLQLTEQGEGLLRYCQTKTQLEAQFIKSIQNKGQSTLAGVIRIGGFSSVMRSVILPSLTPLIINNDGLRVRMVSREIYELKALLKSGEIDFAITYEPLESDTCVSHKIGTEVNTLVQKKSYKGPNIYIDHDENDQITKKLLKRKSFAVNERIFLDDVYGLIDGVKSGIGKAVIPNHLIKNDQQLTPVKPVKTLNIPVYLNYYKQPYYTKLHQKVVGTICDNAKEFLKA